VPLFGEGDVAPLDVLPQPATNEANAAIHKTLRKENIAFLTVTLGAPI
jgi:hypothetical protein